jgi:PTH1 family peptidyl-tRNA hydrolase
MKYLIVGLGNIGPDYEETRHNVGFKVVDELAREFEVSFKLEKLALLTELKFKGRQIIVIKPTTYMNLSGKALKYWSTKENIPIENILVVVDDLALPFGTIRVKSKGSDGGHNGLKDIQAELQTNSYARLRFGIGSAFHSGQQIKYVLGKWDKEEAAELPIRLEKAVEAIKSFCTVGLAHTMNNFNNK